MPRSAANLRANGLAVILPVGGEDVDIVVGLGAVATGAGLGGGDGATDGGVTLAGEVLTAGIPSKGT